MTKITDPDTAILLAPVDWREQFGRLTAGERIDLGRQLDAVAEKAARLSAYLGASEHDGAIADGTHRAAVKSQNITARKVRKALGYSYPNSPITF